MNISSYLYLKMSVVTIQIFITNIAIFNSASIHIKLFLYVPRKTLYSTSSMRDNFRFVFFGCYIYDDR